MRQSVIAGLTVLVATSTVLAGCSSSTKNTSANAPIVIATVGSFSGALAATSNGVRIGIESWAKYTNDRGGLNGRKIKIVEADDQGNATTGLAAVRKVVEQDHVVAIVGEAASSVETWEKYVEGKGVPVIGGQPTETPWLTNPDFYASGTNIIAMLFGTLGLAKQLGPKYGYLYCAEAPLCAQSATLQKAIASQIGLNLVVSTKVSATAPDYTAQCQVLKDSGVQSYAVGATSPTVLKIAAACATQGLTAKQVTNDGTVTQNWLKEPAVDGTLAAENDFPYTDDSTPATKTFQEAIKKYAPSVGSLMGPNVAYGWVAGELFAKAAAAGGSGTVTSASLKKGLYTLHGETLGGLAPPLTFVAGQPNLINCYFSFGIQDGKITEPTGLRTTCAPDAAVAAIVKAF